MKKKKIGLHIVTAILLLILSCSVSTEPEYAVERPTFQPSGGIYTTGQTVSISSETADAIIKYTMDGSEPSASSEIYVSPLSVISTATLTAKAYRKGWKESPAVTAEYIITGVLPLPEFVPPGGLYTEPQSVSIILPVKELSGRDEERGREEEEFLPEDTVIRYTLDESEPDSLSAIYTEPLIIFENKTIKAKTFRENWTSSATAEAKYVIYEPPTFVGLIDAPDQVKVLELFTASVRVNESNDLPVQVKFDWGDGSISEYTDYAPGGSLFSQKHTYSEPGDYQIRAIARSSAGLISESDELIHNITAVEEEVIGLIAEVYILNNRLHLTATEPVSIEFSYFPNFTRGFLYESYRSNTEKSSITVPLPVEAEGIDYWFDLQVFSGEAVQDTVLIFTAKEQEYPLLRVDFVDVRQGDGALIRTPEGEAIAVDGGYGTRVPGFADPAYWNGAGEPLMLNYVIGENVQSFNYLLETHNHMDHWGGLADIRDHYGIPLSDQLSPDNTLGYQTGDFLNINSEVSFEILNIGFPPGVNPNNENNRSIVLRVVYGEIAYLLTGDIEYQVEDYLVGNNFNLSADVLKVAHHGSNSSSTPGFLAATLNRNTKIAILSFGTGNPYNHPRNLHRFSEFDVYGTNLPSHSWDGDNYRFDAGSIRTYTDGYILIVGYEQ